MNDEPDICGECEDENHAGVIEWKWEAYEPKKAAEFGECSEPSRHPHLRCATCSRIVALTESKRTQCACGNSWYLQPNPGAPADPGLPVRVKMS